MRANLFHSHRLPVQRDHAPRGRAPYTGAVARQGLNSAESHSGSNIGSGEYSAQVSLPSLLLRSSGELAILPIPTSRAHHYDTVPNYFHKPRQPLRFWCRTGAYVGNRDIIFYIFFMIVSIVLSII